MFNKSNIYSTYTKKYYNTDSSCNAQKPIIAVNSMCYKITSLSLHQVSVRNLQIENANFAQSVMKKKMLFLGLSCL